MAWNAKEYRKLIISKYGQPAMEDLERYVCTLQWNIDKISLHKEAIKQCWCDVFRPSIVDTSSKEFTRAYFYSMAEGEAIIHSLHSNADIIAHLVNVILNSSKFPSNQVYFKDVKDRLKKKDIAPEVVKVMQGLLDAPEFRYVKAFCNTIKHNCLVDISWAPGNVSEKGSFEKLKSAIKFMPFTYRANNYPAVFLHDIYGRYATAIRDKICAIGDKLNAYLCSG